MFGKNLTSKSSKNKIFRGFRVFQCALWQKTKTWKCRKSTESFLIPKSTQYSVNLLSLLENCQKAVTMLCKYNFGFNNRKATFKLQ